MFTIEDLMDQVDVQGCVIVKEIKDDEVKEVFGGELVGLYSKYRTKEIVYMYPENDAIVIEIQ